MARISSTKFRLFTARVDPNRYASANLTNGDLRSHSATRRTTTDDNVRRRNIPDSLTKLRWTHEPNLGLPRQPFRVWRHHEKFKQHHLLDQPVTVNTNFRVNSRAGVAYYAYIQLNVPADGGLIVLPIDVEGNPVTDATQRVGPGFHVVRIRHPFTAGYRFLGKGTVNRLTVYLQDELINSKDWELIQIVGFPFEQGSLPTNVYDTRTQGMVSAPMPPRDRAIHWIGAEAYLQEPLPGSTTPGGTVPVWEPPPAASFLQAMENQDGGLLPLIRRCLKESKDHDHDPQKRQPAFLAELEVEGLRQEESSASDKGTAFIPVVGTTLLTALMDNYAAMALGYGTIDNQPRHAEGFFYMVTNEYVIQTPPGTGRSGEGIRIELAALGEGLTPPKSLAITDTQTMHQNRPMARDASATAAVQLTIKSPATPCSLGVLRRTSAGVTSILNTNRGLGNDSYQPHIPQLVSADNQQEFPIEYTIPNVELPLAWTDTSDYGVAARDLFGRWAPLSSVQHTLKALPPQRPGLLAVSLNYHDGSVSPGSPTVALDLSIDVSWDWTERTPHAIEIGGLFYPADRDPGTPTTMDRLSREATNLATPLPRITFTSAGVPQISGTGLSVVELSSNDPAADPNLRKYRVRVTGVTGTFPGPLDAPAPANNPSRVAYGVSIRALEQVRQTAGIQEWSDWSEIMRDVLDDPRPPVTLSLPADVTWTALPDAANVARGKLAWPSVDRAVGYMVWQASESAIRTTLGLDAADPTVSYADRATELRDELNQPENDKNSLRAFVRLNRDPITATTTQVELPGDSEVLFVYRVNAVTAAGIESGRSNAVFFAVPKQHRPSSPIIKVDPVRSGPPTLRIMTFPGPGTVPEGYRLYRVRKRMASNVVHMKGLPHQKEDAPGWMPHTEPSLVGPAYEGMRLDDVITPSWDPYYYQAVAVSRHAPAEGLYRAVSSGSPTVEAYYFPDSPPVITRRFVFNRGSYQLIGLDTDGPLVSIKGKSARLSVYAFDDTDSSQPPRLSLLAEADLATVENVAISSVIRMGSRPGGETEEVYKDTGAQSIYLRLNTAAPKLSLRLTDPLGRGTETTLTL